MKWLRAGLNFFQKLAWLFVMPSKFLAALSNNNLAELTKSFGFLLISAILMSVAAIPINLGASLASPVLFITCLGFTGIGASTVGLILHIGCRIFGVSINLARCVTYCNYALNTLALIISSFMLLGIFSIMFENMDFFWAILSPNVYKKPELTQRDKSAILLCLGLGFLGIACAIVWLLASWRGFSAANGLSRWRAVGALSISLLLAVPTLAAAAVLASALAQLIALTAGRL